MDKFAGLVVEDLLKRSNHDLSDYVLITPGKRTGIFLKYMLSQLVEKPVISPTMLTINEFIEKYSGLNQIETIPAVMKLYEVYKTKVSSPESIEQFWFFGEMLLADFDDIDKYLVDASHLFKYIVDLKEIEAMFGGEDDEKLELVKKFWEALYKGVKHHDKDKIRGRFLHFWKILFPLYTEYRDQLKAENKGYDGMLYRLTAEKANRDEVNMDGKIPVFIGFNALSESEKQIFKSLEKQGALYYWDYDVWYTNDTMQEAGYFMRKNLKDFPNAINGTENFDNISKLTGFKTIGVPGELEMAQELSLEAAKQFTYTENPLTNGIILGDETLLTPVLQSVSSEGLNVTMGLPFRSSSLYGFVNLLLEMPSRKKTTVDAQYFSAEWVVNLLQQPFLNSEKTSDLIETIKEQNRFYVTAEELSTDELLKAFFPDKEVDIVSYLKNILLSLIQQENEDAKLSQVNLEAALRVHRALNQIEKQVEEATGQMSQNMLISLIRKLIASINLTLEGEPLKGTQLMGLIEARALDFDNLIIVSANEGFLPSANVAPSFIPYNLRKAYRLLTYENQDAIFAYYFYRAVQRTENLTFIYNSNESDNNYGEQSRFLQQMAFELDVSVEEIIKSHTVKPQKISELTIKKTDEIQKELKKYLDGEAYMYPIRLNTYLNCKLKFYFTYIAGMKEPEKIEPGVNQRIFGLIFHETMEDLYMPFVKSGKVVLKSDLEKLSDTKFILERIRVNMQVYFSDIQLHRSQDGMVELIEQVVLRYVMRVINNDMQSEPFTIPGLEGKYVADYKFDENRSIKLAGKIDRLQQVGNKLWVIDYKTGKSPESYKVKFDELFSCDSSDRSDGAFQAYLYAKIMESDPVGVDKSIIPSLMYIQDDNPPKQVAFSDRKGSSYNDLRTDFEQGLKEVLTDLFDNETSFTQTEDQERCRYCPFRVICQRQ